MGCTPSTKREIIATEPVKRSSVNASSLNSLTVERKVRGTYNLASEKIPETSAKLQKFSITFMKNLLTNKNSSDEATNLLFSKKLTESIKYLEKKIEHQPPGS